MAYRQGNPLVKLIVVAVIAWAAYQYGLPWIQQQGFMSGGRGNSVADTPNVACVSAADAALAVWINGIMRFMNPPIDRGSWDDFRREVERKIDEANAECGCPADSCSKARDVLSDLKRVVSDMDSAARSGGPPPGDLVRSQESIDLKMEEAWKLVDAGK